MFYQEPLLVRHPKLSKRLITWTPGWFQCGRARTTPGYRRERKDREIVPTLGALPRSTDSRWLIASQVLVWSREAKGEMVESNADNNCSLSRK